MAKNNKSSYNKKNNDKNNTKKKYTNPAMTPWGKVIICVLALAMLLSGLISLIVILATKGF